MASTRGDNGRSWCPGVYIADIDSDGDMDLQAHLQGHKVAWYENTNGDGSAWQAHAGRRTQIGPTKSILQILTAMETWTSPVRLQATKRLRGSRTPTAIGLTWQAHVVTTDGNATDVYIADIDGDGDMDLASASAHDDKIGYENTNGDGLVWQPHVVATDADWAFSVHVADIDGDET